MSRRVLAILAAPLMVAALQASTLTAPAQADITVIGDDDRDAFVGSGSLVLPPQIATSNRRIAIDCPGCRWRSVVQCEMTSGGACRGPARLCGPDGYWLRVYLIRPDGTEVNLGAACFGPKGPVTREVVESSVRDRVETLVPPLEMWRQPDGRALPHLPVIFGVNQSEAPITAEVQLVGFPVQIRARPTWVWDFGSRVVTSRSAGRPWPRATIDHTYRRSGAYPVRVTAVWEASYWVGGLGPLAVEQRVTQVDRARIRVGQGRAVLVR